MNTDSVLGDLPPPPDEALAALIASAGFQAQMAASQPATPIGEPIIDIPYGLPVEPIFLAPVDPLPLMPEGPPVTGIGVKLLPVGQSTGWARLAVEPSFEEISTDMLAVLPQPAAAIEVASAVAPAAASGTEADFSFAFMTEERNGAEGGPI